MSKKTIPIILSICVNLVGVNASAQVSDEVAKRVLNYEIAYKENFEGAVKALKSKKAVILDPRRQEAFERLRIKGSVYLDYSKLRTEEGARMMKKLVPEKDTPIVIASNVPVSAPDPVYTILKKMGYKHVYKPIGGPIGYSPSSSLFPLVGTEAEAHDAWFSRVINEKKFLTKAKNKKAIVLDIRSKDQFDDLRYTGATFLEADPYLSNLTKERLAKAVPDKSTPILLFPRRTPMVGQTGPSGAFIILWNNGYRNLLTLDKCFDFVNTKLPLDGPIVKAAREQKK